jgi:hypothetical protein
MVIFAARTREANVGPEWVTAWIAQDSGSGSSLVGLLLPLLAIAFLGAWIWGFMDMGKHTGAEWDASGQNPVLWVLILVFLGVFGLILYLMIARPRLKNPLSRR